MSVLAILLTLVGGLTFVIAYLYIVPRLFDYWDRQKEVNN